MQIKLSNILKELGIMKSVYLLVLCSLGPLGSLGDRSSKGEGG